MKNPARSACAVNTGIETMLFDLGDGELPVATLRPRAAGAHAHAAFGELERWSSERWAWLRPRLVPVIVAAIGMVFVLLSADYLKHAHGAPPRPAPAAIHR
jgi:hypothetical protein